MRDVLRGAKICGAADKVLSAVVDGFDVDVEIALLEELVVTVGTLQLGGGIRGSGGCR